MTDILTVLPALLCGGLIWIGGLFAVLAALGGWVGWNRDANRERHDPARDGLPQEAYWLWDDTDGFQSWVGINTPLGAKPPPWRGEGVQRIPHSPTSDSSEKR